LKGAKIWETVGTRKSKFDSYTRQIAGLHIHVISPFHFLKTHFGNQHREKRKRRVETCCRHLFTKKKRQQSQISMQFLSYDAP